MVDDILLNNKTRVDCFDTTLFRIYDSRWFQREYVLFYKSNYQYNSAACEHRIGKAIDIYIDTQCVITDSLTTCATNLPIKQQSGIFKEGFRNGEGVPVETGTILTYRSECALVDDGEMSVHGEATRLLAKVRYDWSIVSVVYENEWLRGGKQIAN